MVGESVEELGRWLGHVVSQMETYYLMEIM